MFAKEFKRTREETEHGSKMDVIFEISGKKEGLENLVLTGKIEGNRDRGRQRKTFLGSLREQVANKWRTNIRSSEILHLARERGRWNIMIANVVRHGT